MGQEQYLIDSNAVIDYLGNKYPKSGMSFMSEIIDLKPKISVISKIEILGFNTTVEYNSILVDFMKDALLFELSNEVIERTISIRKKYRTKIPDAIIAATALVYNLTLISRNFSDFKKIDGLKIIDPHST